MNVKERKAINEAISELVAAEIDLSWSGSQDPAARPVIERNAKDARRRLKCLLNAQMDIAPDAKDAV